MNRSKVDDRGAVLSNRFLAQAKIGVLEIMGTVLDVKVFSKTGWEEESGGSGPPGVEVVYIHDH